MWTHAGINKTDTSTKKKKKEEIVSDRILKFYKTKKNCLVLKSSKKFCKSANHIINSQ